MVIHILIECFKLLGVRLTKLQCVGRGRKDSVGGTDQLERLFPAFLVPDGGYHRSQALKLHYETHFQATLCFLSVDVE